MDIDEFLDRELSDLGLQTGKSEKEAIEIPEFEGAPEQHSLFENIKASLSKGNLKQAEQSYLQLWHALMQQKLKWNKELYGQLLILGRQLSSVLSQALSDVKRKSMQINELISSARASFKEGKREMPLKLYSEIQAIFNSIPNVFFEEKRMLEQQISDFYKELKNTTDSELIRKVASLMHEISQLIDKTNFAIQANDMANAVYNYNKCIQLYNQVPEGFFMQRNSVGMKILEIYKNLSIYNEISELQSQLRQQHVRQSALPQETSSLSSIKKERAKKNLQKGFYNEAAKEIGEALQLDPNDAEAKAIHAKIRTLQ
ncbi:hypothetical protein HYX02_03800 [Candidatus Woesearchaeota archaeon]|nr:hypothetical protein [Candidatus Woesearchaeota archaeon]